METWPVPATTAIPTTSRHSWPTWSAVAASAVWVLFALLPFLRAGSGAAGAFIATFVVLLVLRGRRR